MKDYVYDLGMDDLVQYGADQYVTGLDVSLFPNAHLGLSVRSYALGEETFKRYRSLVVEGGGLPFVRTAGSKRVVQSAQNWTHGAFLICLQNCGLYVNDPFCRFLSGKRRNVPRLRRFGYPRNGWS